MDSLLKNDYAIEQYAKRLAKRYKLFFEASDEGRAYKSDEERREMVKKFREAEATGDVKTAQKMSDALFYEIELAIYNLANSLSSGSRSRRSGSEYSGSVHNNAEDLVQIGVEGYLRALKGGTITDKNGVRVTGFDPDGPGTFIGFMLKTIEGYMKNSHTRERKKFGREKTSLDAPRGEDDDDSNLYNAVFADSDLRFDAITSDSEYEEFLDSDAYEMLIDLLGDLANEREIEIFCHYYGINGYEKLTPTNIGIKYGFSKQRANHIVDKVLKKLHERLMVDKTGVSRGHGDLDESSEESVDTSLNGLPLNVAKKTVTAVWDRCELTDENGKSKEKLFDAIHNFFEALNNADIDYNVLFDRSVDGKLVRRYIEFKFTDSSDKPSRFVGVITAAGTGQEGRSFTEFTLGFAIQ
jgi:RNA polymerase sigma factor (sigma-70 family)